MVGLWHGRRTVSRTHNLPMGRRCVYFRGGGLQGILCAIGIPASARAGTGCRQTKRKECRHGKANDDRGQEAHRLPPPAGLDSSPDSGRQGTQQVHHPPRDNQPLGPVRQRLQRTPKKSFISAALSPPPFIPASFAPHETSREERQSYCEREKNRPFYGTLWLQAT